MPCPHNEISIVQRSHRQSAVAAAAYQSGEKLFCEYDQQVKHYPEKRGIVHNEILLPANAPLEYTDRNTLWNAAEAVEKQWNSQLARRWVLSIPREIPPDQYAALVRDFCRQQFVSKGMCVDFAIHDKGDGNPHAHVMLTMETFQPPYRIRYNNAITVRYSPYTSEWRISNKSATGFGDIMATETYGTRRANAYKILEDTLNLRDSRVYDTIEEDGKEKRVLNQNETTLAQQKQQAIKDAFAGWVWKDPQRRTLLVKRYNELFNSTRPREYDGSHIHFVGIEEMQKRVDAATARYHELGDSIKAAETRMAEIAVLRTHIVNYARTRPVYDAYRKAGYSKKFLGAHREEITLHKAAKAAFDEAGLKKLPKAKDLSIEYAELLKKKKEAYPDYRKARDEMQELMKAQKNVEIFFAEKKSTTEKEQIR